MTVKIKRLKTFSIAANEKEKKKLLYPALRFESSLSQHKGETTVGGCFLRSAIEKSGLTGHLCLVRRR